MKVHELKIAQRMSDDVAISHMATRKIKIAFASLLRKWNYRKICHSKSIVTLILSLPTMNEGGGRRGVGVGRGGRVAGKTRVKHRENQQCGFLTGPTQTKPSISTEDG